jgi:hypothetical protein
MSKIPGEGWTKPAIFQLAKNKTLAISMEVHVAAREKLIALFASKGIYSGLVIIKGGEEQNLYDSDTNLLFRLD